MLRNYYTLIRLAEEFKVLTGSRIAEFFSQDKDSAIICFSSANTNYYLDFVSSGNFDSIHLKNKYHRPKKNTVDLMEDAIDEIISLFINISFPLHFSPVYLYMQIKLFLMAFSFTLPLLFAESTNDTLSSPDTCNQKKNKI